MNASKPALLLSSAYFPPLEYWVYMLKYSNVWIDEYETYPKQTWRNRCRVLTGNGPVNLSIPVEKPLGNITQTHQVVLSTHYPWRKNHWRTLHTAYRNAPYYIYYADLVEEMLLKESTSSLVQLNRQILHAFIKELEIPVKPLYTTGFIRDTQGYTDLRFALSPKVRDRQSLPSLSFKPYYQVFEDRLGFDAQVSILDALFNLGPDLLSYLQETAGANPAFE